MSILSYISILCLIPYFAEKDNKYVRYHAIQGLNLFLISTIYSVALMVISPVLVFVPIVGWILMWALTLISYLFIALSIWGIVNVFQNKIERKDEKRCIYRRRKSDSYKISEAFLKRITDNIKNNPIK